VDTPPALPGAEIFLAADQARHGALVLRLTPGEPIELVGPAGLAPARVSLVEKSPPRLAAALTGPWAQAAARGPRLALALIQSQRFDWAVEKSVELGASALIPLITERVKSGEARPGAAKQDRWKRLAEEARKQCGRASALDISPVTSLSELTAQAENQPGLFLSPTGPSGPPPETADAPILVVGPEGGLTPAEESALTQAGFLPWSLGPTILRAETAALAALAVMMARPA
jgi:16S rRNA (uracil1498-N3)-methyltransferase